MPSGTPWNAPVQPTTGPWTERLLTLVRACAWDLPEAKQKLGPGVRRVIRGGKPSVGMLLNLEKLEKAYAGEIEGYRLGIQGRQPGRTRARWYFGERRPASELDRFAGQSQGSQEVAEMGASVQRATARGARGLVRAARQGGGKSPADRARGLGRPEAERGRPECAVEGAE